MYNFVVNNKSNSRKTKRLVRRISQFFDARELSYKFHYTEYQKHCIEIVRQLSSKENAKIIVMGGDGTFHEALNGIADFESTTLGLIPSGSGNDFAAFFKPAKQGIKKILEDIILERTHLIDYIEFIDGTRCLNVAGTGLDIEVLLKARAFRRITGKPNYIKCLVRTLKRFDPYELTVTYNGKTETYNCIMIGLCNGRQMGGGIKISPYSRLDDGKLNLVIMKDIARKDIKWQLPRFISGRHITRSYTVHELISDSVQISSKNNYKVQLDGEIYSNLTFDAHVVPKGLKVYGRL